MKLPLQISFHGIERTDAVEQAIRERCARLDRFAADIMACRVVLDQGHAHQRQGRELGVAIELTVPGRRLVANRAHHEDLLIALRDAFDDMKRQLEDWVRERGDQVRQPAREPRSPEPGDESVAPPGKV